MNPIIVVSAIALFFSLLDVSSAVDGQKILDKYDADHDGKLSFEEATAIAESEGKQVTREKFDQFDLNHDGGLDKDELDKIPE
ncbi:hypothetical protein DdX_11387 [Ditylenchus destructor]|uniref:EF-hand domain-containing protein n=1 Tax=Ditylenchus destructor TaxID=166010 RepID=A0AAD4R4L8_9BILA|nr:hypothetical protein DdX_11387 [Ditylenchus destructor]